MLDLLKMLIFPGFAFLLAYGMALEFVDRKVYARLQNRVGPPWFQPLADFFKLIGKETIIPADARPFRFRLLPLFSLASVAAAFIYVPVVGLHAASSFEGDVIIVLYLSMVPALCAFLAGWYSRSVYATLGSTRVMTQLFSYEAPLFVALLAPSLLARTWSLEGLAQYYAAHPQLLLLNIPAFCVAMITTQGKLERIPFDQSEAETEIVGGVFVEYGGRLLAIFRLAIDCEMVLMLSIAASVFLPFTTGVAVVDFLLYLIKTLALLMILTLMRAGLARLRMEQMVSFCWKVVTPVALAQMLFNLLIRGGLPF